MSNLLRIAFFSAAFALSGLAVIAGHWQTQTATSVMFDAPEADRILSSLQVFPPDNPWNQDISRSPVHPNSAAVIASIGNDKRIDFNLDMNFVIVPPGQPRVPVKITLYPHESDPGPFPVPDNMPIENWPLQRNEDGGALPKPGESLDYIQRNGTGDRHGIVVDPAAGLLYEFYQARKTDAGWEAAQASIFDLKSNRLRPERWTSADAAGLPIFPSIVRYDECERGMVNHAMRFTVRRTRRAYVHPARHFASRLTAENLPRMGERMRLRRDFDITNFPPHAQAILKGLKKYGMFVADNGGDWRLSIAPDRRLKGLESLTKLKGSDFEVVDANAQQSMREVNDLPRPATSTTTAIVGATLIDGRGGSPVEDAVVIVQGEKIIAAGTRASTPVAKDAEMIDAKGLALLPGLIDAHFHLDGDEKLPTLFLSRGITSVRDPGAWIEAYAGVRRSGQPIPRLFLAGPHLDNAPPAYPKDSFIVRDAEETRLAVDRFIDQGASVIKVYFRLPLGLARVAAETAHARGVPVTAHLEILDAADAIRAGVDGIEHITSFGTALMPALEAEKYRQSILADNNARREGRYKVWSEIDLDGPNVRALLELIGQRGVFISPTLAVFEKQKGDKDATEMHVRAFAQMLKFVGMAKGAGGRVVAGSHSSVPHAQRGWAYQRELELLVASGLKPMEAITAATMENARFFRITDRLGSIEAGKLADLILIDGDPLKDISAMRRVKRVMLNGRWIE